VVIGGGLLLILLASLIKDLVSGCSLSDTRTLPLVLGYCKLLLYDIRVESLAVEVNVGKLQELRINQGLSQRRLAELAGVSNTSVWED
jgi:hypothetical protein